MNASRREAIDYSRFAERLASHRANQDPAKRWDLYRELHAEWGYVPRQARGPLSPELLDAVGKAPSPSDVYDGLPGIPVALAEWMALTENISDDINAGGLECIWPPSWCEPDAVGGGYSKPLAPGSLLAVPGSDDLRMVRFVADDQCMFEIAYRSANAVATDPAAFRYLDGGWAAAAPSITEFALHLAASRLPIVFGWHATPPDGFEDKVIERVRTTWPEMGFPVGREPYPGDMVLHGGPDAIAMVADPDGNWWDYEFLLNGRTKEAVEAAAVLLSGAEAPLDQWYVWEGEL